ncbi:unnamed protein product [Ixodes hexagonus]
MLTAGFEPVESLPSPQRSSSPKWTGPNGAPCGSTKYCQEWFSLFESGNIAQKLCNKAMTLELADCKFRSICWKASNSFENICPQEVFLECLPDSRDDWICVTRAMRQKYESLLEKVHTPCLNDRLREHNLNVNNHRDGHLSVHCHDCGCRPLFNTCAILARHKDKTVREIIEADLIKQSGAQCVSVASIDLLDKEVAFLRGMHELLAPIIFVLHSDQQAFLHALELGFIKEFPSNLREDIRELLNPDFTEHDAFFLFCQVMEAVESWYSWTETYTKLDQFSFMPFSKTNLLGVHNGLGVKLCRINQAMLKTQDPAVFAHLENMEIPLHVFGIRWLRLLFGREFILPELLILWDAIFADSLAFNLVDHIFVAMLTCIRKLLLSADYAQCLSYLMKYPAGRKVTYILQLALHMKDPKKYTKPAEQELDVYAFSTAPRGSAKYARQMDLLYFTSSNRTSGRPTTLGISTQGSRANSEPTTLDSDSDLSDAEASGAASGSGGKAPVKGQCQPNQVWSLKGIKKTAITQSLNLLANGNGDALTEKEMVQLNASTSRTSDPGLPLRGTHKAAGSELSALQKEVCEMRSVMDSCWRQMSTNLSLLQDCVLSQKQDREHEIVLALARLKRVRDTLKGAIECTDSSQEEDDGNPDYVMEDWTLVSSDEPGRMEGVAVMRDADSVSLRSWTGGARTSRRDSDPHTQEVKKQFLKALVQNHKGPARQVERAAAAAEDPS